MLYYIYRITIGDNIYIGSTKDFDQRKCQHRSACKMNKNVKIYNIINENGGWDACEMTPIEEFQCETYIAALIREEYWRREYKATMNSKKAYQTEEEYQAQKKLNNANTNPKRDKTSLACLCGGNYCYTGKTNHVRTKRHQEYMKTLNTELLEVDLSLI
jgi:hypothetical protein